MDKSSKKENLDQLDIKIEEFKSKKIKANTFSKLYYKIKKSNFNFKLFV